MSRWREAVALTALILLAAQLLVAEPTYACSVGPDFNPVAEADLIVGGRITDWEELPMGAGAPFTPIRLTMAVDRRIKGEVPTEWVDDKNEPLTFQVEFVRGKAEVDENIGRYLIDQGLAKKTKLILPDED